MGTSTASFKARALMRFDRDVRPARSECSAKLQPEEAARVPLVDLHFVRVAGPYPLHGRDGIADEPRSLLGIEWKIRAEHHPALPRARLRHAVARQVPAAPDHPSDRGSGSSGAVTWPWPSPATRRGDVPAVQHRERG